MCNSLTKWHQIRKIFLGKETFSYAAFAISVSDDIGWGIPAMARVPS